MDELVDETLNATEIIDEPQEADENFDVEMHQFGRAGGAMKVPNDSIFSEPEMHSDL